MRTCNAKHTQRAAAQPLAHDIERVTRTRSSSLNDGRRTAEIDRLDGGETVDVVVIGGGITGAGVALDAATRGLRVALVERRDLASGTSGLSSKLAHGGLRYLRQGEVAVAWESARERHILMTRTAPHLVRPMPFVAPLDAAMRPVYGAFAETGIRVGDVMRAAAGTRSGTLPGPRRIGADEALRLIPSLRTRDLRGAILFWDGKLEDDVRLVIAVARTAAANGAMILTYCDAVDVERGRVGVRDVVSGRRFEIGTTHVVNATGVWANGLAPGVHLAPSKGSHIIVRARALGNLRASLVVPIAGESARWVGATPAGDGHVIVGVTDEPYDGPLDAQPQVTAAEERYLLDALSRALEVPLDHRDVIGSYAGLRPLLSAGAESTRDLSRRHAIVEDPRTGMVTVVGGKLTTYRRMAQDTVDHIAPGRPSRTAALPLVGAAPAAVLRALEVPDRLRHRYGVEAPSVMALGDGDPSLLRPLAGGVTALGVEIVFGVLHEGARTLDDVLDRRVRLGLVPAERRAAEEAAARLVG